MQNRKRRRHGATRAGFTLIEFLVVVTIIGVLAALIFPRFFGRVGQTRQAVARANIRVLEAKIMEFQTDCSRYPTAAEGLHALLRKPADVADAWRGPYVKEKDILDPWGNEYGYRYPAQRGLDFDLFSYGSDGQEGGEDEAGDIWN